MILMHVDGSYLKCNRRSAPEYAFAIFLAFFLHRSIFNCWLSGAHKQNENEMNKLKFNFISL